MRLRVARKMMRYCTHRHRISTWLEAFRVIQRWCRHEPMTITVVPVVKPVYPGLKYYDEELRYWTPKELYECIALRPAVGYIFPHGSLEVLAEAEKNRPERT